MNQSLKLAFLPAGDFVVVDDARNACCTVDIPVEDFRGTVEAPVADSCLIGKLVSVPSEPTLKRCIKNAMNSFITSILFYKTTTYIEHI